MFVVLVAVGGRVFVFKQKLQKQIFGFCGEYKYKQKRRYCYFCYLDAFGLTEGFFAFFSLFLQYYRKFD